MKHIFVFPKEGIDHEKLTRCTKNLKAIQEVITDTLQECECLSYMMIELKQELYIELRELNAELGHFSDRELEELKDVSPEDFHNKMTTVIGGDHSTFKVRLGDDAGRTLVVLDNLRGNLKHPIFWAWELGYLRALGIEHVEEQ